MVHLLYKIIIDTKHSDENKKILIQIQTQKYKPVNADTFYILQFTIK